MQGETQHKTAESGAPKNAPAEKPMGLVILLASIVVLGFLYILGTIRGH